MEDEGTSQITKYYYVSHSPPPPAFSPLLTSIQTNITVAKNIAGLTKFKFLNFVQYNNALVLDSEQNMTLDWSITYNNTCREYDCRNITMWAAL